MLPWVLGGLALGALKGRQDQIRADRQRGVEAEVARYSPWTGFAPRPVQEADMMGSMMQGGMGGAMLGQGIAQTDMQNQMLQNQRAMSGGNPWTGMNVYQQQPGTMIG